MSPLVFREGKFVFWFHSYDVLHESRASIHVGKEAQNDAGDAKIWPEPQIEVGRPGPTLNRNELKGILVGYGRLGMSTKEKPSEQTSKWCGMAYPASAYTFPREALLHRVHFDENYMHLELTDRRILSVPLSWIPTLHNAPPEERENMKFSHDRKMIIWDPGKCSINDEVRVEDHLVSRSESDVEKDKD